MVQTLPTQRPVNPEAEIWVCVDSQQRILTNLLTRAQAEAWAKNPLTGGAVPGGVKVASIR